MHTHIYIYPLFWTSFPFRSTQNKVEFSYKTENILDFEAFHITDHHP